MARTPKKSRSKAKPAAEKAMTSDSSRIQRLKRQRRKADQEYNQFRPLLDEAYDYAIPFRKGVEHGGKGEERVNRAFDQTAIVGAFRFAGRLWQDFVGEEMFKLAPGDLLPAKEKDQLRPQLEQLSMILAGMTSNGEFDMAFHEMGLDLSASTGAMLVLEGEDVQQPARFVSVPFNEVRLLSGRYGSVGGVFWSRKWPVWEIADEYDNDLDKIGPNLRQKIKDKPEDDEIITQACIYDARKKLWVTSIWADCDDVIIRSQEARTCPWITPRYFRVPGETIGRGPVMLAMPSIKTLNTAQSLSLQAAAIAMLGIWTAVNDGVFNPDMSTIEPGAIWTVARNGGVLGPSVQRLQDPNIDLSNIIINDLRMAVQAAMMDQSLPPDGAAVKSATEILERAKRLASDHTGAFGRLVYEIIVPLARRLIEIAYNKGLIPFAPDIDQILVKVKITSPLATARAAERMQKIVQWIDMVLAILQDAAPSVAKLQDALEYIGHELGVPSEFIVTREERQEMEEQQQQQQEAEAALNVAAESGALEELPV